MKPEVPSTTLLLVFDDPLMLGKEECKLCKHLNLSPPMAGGAGECESPEPLSAAGNTSSSSVSLRPADQGMAQPLALMVAPADEAMPDAGTHFQNLVL
jgi:hypothetical protein